MTECSSLDEFNSISLGNRIDVKILKVTEDKANVRTWIELTRKEKHMQKPHLIAEKQQLVRVKIMPDIEVKNLY